MEQLQGSADALQEIHLVPLGAFESRPGDPANFGHRGKPIVQLGEIAVRFPRIAPGPVDAHAAFAGRVLTGDVVLVVGAGGLRCGHSFPSDVGMLEFVLSSFAKSLAD